MNIVIAFKVSINILTTQRYIAVQRNAKDFRPTALMKWSAIVTDWSYYDDGTASNDDALNVRWGDSLTGTEQEKWRVLEYSTTASFDEQVMATY